MSDRERIAHVIRRLSMGAHPDLLAALDDTDAAIARALDTSGPAVDTTRAARADRGEVGRQQGPRPAPDDRLVGGPHAAARSPGRGTPHVVLARPLRHVGGEGGAVRGEPTARDVAPTRAGELRRSVEGGGEGSGHVVLPRRRHQCRRRAQRELRPRVPRAVHHGPGQRLHARRCGRGLTRVHRVGRRHPRPTGAGAARRRAVERGVRPAPARQRRQDAARHHRSARHGRGPRRHPRTAGDGALRRLQALA